MVGLLLLLLMVLVLRREHSSTVLALVLVGSYSHLLGPRAIEVARRLRVVLHGAGRWGGFFFLFRCGARRSRSVRELFMYLLVVETIAAATNRAERHKAKRKPDDNGPTHNTGEEDGGPPKTGNPPWGAAFFYSIARARAG